MKKHPLNHRDESGMSLIESLISILLLGVAATAFVMGGKSYIMEKKTAKSLPVMSRYAAQAVFGGMKVLSEVEAADRKKTEGLCSLVTTPAPAPGVGNIDLRLFPVSPDYRPGIADPRPFSNSRWEKFLPGWQMLVKPQDECKQINNWQKCFVVKPENRLDISDADLLAAKILAVVNVEPVYTNPTLGLYSPVPLSSLDAKSTDIKNVGFNVTADIYYNRFKTADSVTRSVKRLAEFLWAPAVGNCDHKLKSGEEVKLSLAGTGASDPTGQTVYNRADFSGTPRDPLRTNFRKNQVQQGVMADGRVVRTDVSRNVATSCNESRYQCPNTPSSTRRYGTVNIDVDLDYSPRNSFVSFASEMTVTPTLSIVRRNSLADSRGSRFSYALDSAAGSAFRVNGSHSLQVQINDVGRESAANNMCRNICDKATNYNKNGSRDSDRYMAQLRYQFAGFRSELTATAENSFSCTACYMKNCSQIGLGTFGPMEEQPYQPLDSRIPECWLGDSSVSNQNPYSKTPFVFEEGQGQCLSGRIDPQGDRLYLQPRSCTDKLPVLCYNFGRFMLARTLNASNWSLTQSDFANGNGLCLQMGSEAIQQQNLDALLGGQTQMRPPLVGGLYSFINLASQGIFLAPQIEKDVVELRNWLSKEGITNQRFWVALRSEGGVVRAAAPLLAPAINNEKHALFYDDVGKPVIEAYNMDLGSYAAANAPGADYLLFHHIRYRGAMPAAATQSRSFRYLCLRNSGVFVSNRRGFKSDEGAAICQEAGGKFHAPRTPLDWVNGMVQVKPLMDGQPFPNPAIKKAEDLDPVWVAAKDSQVEEEEEERGEGETGAGQ